MSTAKTARAYQSSWAGVTQLLAPMLHARFGVNARPPREGGVSAVIVETSRVATLDEVRLGSGCRIDDGNVVGRGNRSDGFGHIDPDTVDESPFSELTRSP